MTGRLRIAGVAFVVCLLGMAQLASAAEFKAGAYPAKLTGLQLTTMHLKFEKSTLETECEFIKMESNGNMAAATSTLQFSVDFHYEGKKCSGLGFAKATIEMNGCELLFHLTAGGADNFGGTMDIVCPAGESMKVVAATCEVSIGAQNGLGPISFTRNTASDDMTFGFAVGGTMAYNRVKDGLLCPLAKTGALNDGDFIGSATVHAENPNDAEQPYLFYAE